MSLDMLKELKDQIPVMNERARKQLLQTRDIQLQAAIKNAQPGTPVVQGAQQLATAAAAQTGAGVVQTAQQAQEANAGIQKLAIQQASQDSQANLAQRELQQNAELAQAQQAQALTLNREANAAKKQITNADIESANRVARAGMEQDNKLLFLSIAQRESLNKLGNDVKDQVLDSRLRFDKDEAGRKFSNERQLADFAIQDAKNEQALRSKLMTIQHASDNKVRLMKAAYDRIAEAENRAFEEQGAKANFELKVKLSNMKKAAAERTSEAQRNANKTRGMITGAFTVAGAAVGAFFTWGAGTAAGAAAGAAIGGAVGNAASGNEQVQRAVG